MAKVAQLPSFIGKFDLTLNDEDLALKADEINLPEIVAIKQGHNAGGLQAERKIPMGTYEPMVASFKLAGFGDILISSSSLCLTEGDVLIFNGKSTSCGSSKKDTQIIMRGSVNKWPLGTIKKGELSSTTPEYDIVYLNIIVDSASVFERDDEAGFIKIDGKLVR